MVDKLNHRQRRFALNIVAGMTPKQAFNSAGYSDNPVRINCGPYQLLALPHVAQFIDEKRCLIESAIVDNDIENLLSVSEKRRILADIARASLADHLDDAGDIKLDKAKAKALKEYYRRTHTDKDGNPITTKSIKLLDPLAAIQEDNKMMGDYAPQKHLVARVNYEVEFIPKLRSGEAQTLLPSGEVQSDNDDDIEF